MNERPLDRTRWPWTVRYKLTKASPEIETGLGAPTSDAVWCLWTMWRTVHGITDYYMAIAERTE